MAYEYEKRAARCMCGAEFSAEGYYSYVQADLKAWQEIHKDHGKPLATGVN